MIGYPSLVRVGVMVDGLRVSTACVVMADFVCAYVFQYLLGSES